MQRPLGDACHSADASTWRVRIPSVVARKCCLGGRKEELNRLCPVTTLRSAVNSAKNTAETAVIIVADSMTVVHTAVHGLPDGVQMIKHTPHRSPPHTHTHTHTHTYDTFVVVQDEGTADADDQGHAHFDEDHCTEGKVVATPHIWVSHAAVGDAKRVRSRVTQQALQ